MNTSSVKSILYIVVIISLSGCVGGGEYVRNHSMFADKKEYSHTHNHEHYDHNVHKFTHNHTHDHPSSEHQHTHGNLSTKEYQHFQKRIGISIKPKAKNPDAIHPSSIYPQHPHTSYPQTYENGHHNH